MSTDKDIFNNSRRGMHRLPRHANGARHVPIDDEIITFEVPFVRRPLVRPPHLFYAKNYDVKKPLDVIIEETNGYLRSIGVEDPIHWQNCRYNFKEPGFEIEINIYRYDDRPELCVEVRRVEGDRNTYHAFYNGLWDVLTDAASSSSPPFKIW